MRVRGRSPAVHGRAASWPLGVTSTRAARECRRARAQDGEPSCCSRPTARSARSADAISDHQQPSQRLLYIDDLGAAAVRKYCRRVAGPENSGLPAPMAEIFRVEQVYPEAERQLRNQAARGEQVTCTALAIAKPATKILLHVSLGLRNLRLMILGQNRGRCVKSAREVGVEIPSVRIDRVVLVDGRKDPVSQHHLNGVEVWIQSLRNRDVVHVAAQEIAVGVATGLDVIPRQAVWGQKSVCFRIVRPHPLASRLRVWYRCPRSLKGPPVSRHLPWDVARPCHLELAGPRCFFRRRRCFTRLRGPGGPGRLTIVRKP